MNPCSARIYRLNIKFRETFKLLIILNFKKEELYYEVKKMGQGLRSAVRDTPAV